MAIRDVLSVYGGDLAGDEDGFDEIQTSLNDCEWGLLNEFLYENLHLSFIFSFHTSKFLIFMQLILVH